MRCADLAPRAMRRARKKPLRLRREERILPVIPRRSTSLPRNHLQGRCSPLGPWEDESCSHQGGIWTLRSGCAAGVAHEAQGFRHRACRRGDLHGRHTGMREFRGTERGSEWPRDLIQIRSVYSELLRCCMDVLVERGAYGRTVACNTWYARHHAVRRGLSATFPILEKERSPVERNLTVQSVITP